MDRSCQLPANFQPTTRLRPRAALKGALPDGSGDLAGVVNLDAELDPAKFRPSSGQLPIRPDLESLGSLGRIVPREMTPAFHGTPASSLADILELGLGRHRGSHHRGSYVTPYEAVAVFYAHLRAGGGHGGVLALQLPSWLLRGRGGQPPMQVLTKRSTVLDVAYTFTPAEYPSVAAAARARDASRGLVLPDETWALLERERTAAC